jgi:hypothetical protein
LQPSSRQAKTAVCQAKPSRTPRLGDGFGFGLSRGFVTLPQMTSPRQINRPKALFPLSEIDIGGSEKGIKTFAFRYQICDHPFATSNILMPCSSWIDFDFVQFERVYAGQDCKATFPHTVSGDF